MEFQLFHTTLSASLLLFRIRKIIENQGKITIIIV